MRYGDTGMYERVLRRMRACVRNRQYVLTLHAEEEMVADGFTIFDVERGILTGEIVERQKDVSTEEWKYCVRGSTVHGDEIELVAKIGPTGQLVVITTYRP